MRFEHAFVRAGVSYDEVVVDPIRGVFALVHALGWSGGRDEDIVRVTIAVDALRERAPADGLAYAHAELRLRKLVASVTALELDIEAGRGLALLTGDVRAWRVSGAAVDAVATAQVLGEEQPRAKPEFAHIVTASLGHDPLRVNRTEFDWPPGATLLLATSRVAERVSADQMRAVALGEDLGHAVGALVDAGAPGGAALAVRYAR